MSKLLRRAEARWKQARKDSSGEPELCRKLCRKAEELLTCRVDLQAGLRHGVCALKLASQLRDPLACSRWTAAALGRIALAQCVSGIKCSKPELAGQFFESGKAALDRAFSLDPPPDVRGYLFLRLTWINIYQGRGEDALIAAHKAVDQCKEVDLVRAHIALAAAWEACGEMEHLIAPAQNALEESLKHPKATVARISAMHAYVNALTRGSASDKDLLHARKLLPELRESLNRRTYRMHRTKLHWTEGKIEERLAQNAERKLKEALVVRAEESELDALRLARREHRRNTRKHYQWALEGFLALKSEPEIAMVVVDLLQTYDDPEWVVDDLVERAAGVIRPGSALHEPLETLRRAAEDLSRKARASVLAAAERLRSDAGTQTSRPAPAL